MTGGEDKVGRDHLREKPILGEKPQVGPNQPPYQSLSVEPQF
jgi:hypothetical protein